MQGSKGSEYLPVKVSQEKIDRILHDIKLGSPIKYATEANGLSEDTFHLLIRQAKQQLKEGLEESFQIKLLMSLRKIQSDRVQSCQLDIRMNEKGHRGAEWILEQNHWRDFGRHAQIKELAAEIDELRIKQNMDEIEEKLKVVKERE